VIGQEHAQLGVIAVGDAVAVGGQARHGEIVEQPRLGHDHGHGEIAEARPWARRARAD
jgi:hypothetical protein